MARPVVRMEKLLLGLKAAFMLGLFITFFIVFAKPAVNRYNRHEYHVKSSQAKPEDKKGKPRMAITVCLDFGVGWKTQENWQSRNLSSVRSKLNTLCGNLTSAEEIYNCVDNKTYEKNEIVTEEVISNSYLEDYGWELNWTTLFPGIQFGKCYTASLDTTNFTADFAPRKMRFLELKYSLNYRIFIHDPKYFILSENQLTHHALQIDIISPANTSQFWVDQQIRAVKNSRKPRQRSVEPLQCEQREDYSWTECAERHFVDTVGCSLRWSGVNGTRSKICTEYTEVMEYLEKKFDNIGEGSSQRLS